jgi:PAS domain S-box-containing protein
MVDVPTAYASLLASRLAEEGWKVDVEHADGADALSAALHRRGWNAVLYGGEQPGSVPARKALALVRLADPHLPFLAVSPNVRRGDLSSLIRGLDDAVLVVSDPAQLSGALTKELDAARLRRRVGSAHHLLMAQQAIADHLVAGLEPTELCSRVLATLGETLGWDVGTVWRPTADGSLLEAAAVWHAHDARPEVVGFAELTRGERFAPGQAMPGRVWAFRRPSWTPDVSRDARMPRASQALRAGLMTAVAFPLAVGDDCAGVIEFLSRSVHEPNGEVSAMFATIGGQLAQYLERRRDESLRVDRARGFLDAADALIVVLDAGGSVLLANARAAAAVGLPEAEIVGQDWFALAVPRGGRQEARGAFERVMAGEAGSLGHRLPSAGGERRAVSFHASALDDEGGVLLLGHAQAVAGRAAVAAAR